MTEQRELRETTSRKEEARPDDSWVPASVLPPLPKEEGWDFRWVRTSALGHPDNANVSQKFREGWVPVKQNEYPELKNLMSDVDSKWKDGVEIGGLLACKIPSEILAKRREYYENMAASQMTSVDRNYMRENDPRMPLLSPERSTRTSFGKG